MVPRLPLCAAAAGLAALALLVAGCGGSGSPGVAAIGTTTTAAPTGSRAASQSPLEQVDRYAACMRAHGVPRFPDPTSANGGLKLVIRPGSGIDPHSASFQAAATACQPLLPKPKGGKSSPQLDAKDLAGLLSFARCMRRHGVQGFPDPTSRGLTVEMVRAAGVDLASPKVQAAARACLPAANGALTAAQVKRAETGGPQDEHDRLAPHGGTRRRPAAPDMRGRGPLPHGHHWREPASPARLPSERKM